MHAKNIDHMFHDLVFSKPSEEIVEASKKKVISLKAKIEERQRRIGELRKEYGIDDAALVQLLTAARKQANAMQFTYSTVSNTKVSAGDKMEERTIGAGVVNNLLTENDFIEAERDQVATLERIIRNLKPQPRFATGDGTRLPDAEFSLTAAELDYLGF